MLPTTRTLHGDELSWLHLMLLGAIPARYEVPSQEPSRPAPVLLVASPDELGSPGPGSTDARVDLLDPEGVTLASVEVEQVKDGFVAGAVRERSGFSIVDHIELRLSPAQARARHSSQLTWALWSSTPISAALRSRAKEMAQEAGAALVEIAPVPTGAETSRVANAAVRLATASAASPSDVLVVPDPNLPWNAGAMALRAAVAERFGFARLLTADALDATDDTSQAIPVQLVSLDVGQPTIPADLLDAFLLHGSALPSWAASDRDATELQRTYRPRSQTGLTVLLSGLSGSGKSTVARSLAVRLMERERRSVTLLDGDVVRHQLSKGLGFSRPDRITNVLRIGFVASEITKAGGIAVCCPIAPYDETRKQVRAMVEEQGAFVLVHVATPLEECERRDRKGLYAKARRGEIPEFTGISDPYEEPEDADVVIDTTGRSIDSCVDDVMSALHRLGVVDG
jgi:sulfate adenylyltransferase